MKFKELDVVKIITSKYSNIKKGSIGTIITVFAKPNEAYDVEFVSDNGKESIIKVFLPTELEKVEDEEYYAEQSDDV